MNKLLEDAIETIRALPDEDQELATEILFTFANRRMKPYLLAPSEREAVQRGLAEADRGKFVSEEVVNGLLKRPWR